MRNDLERDFNRYKSEFPQLIGKITDDVLKNIEKNFNNESTFQGNPWEARKSGGDRKILQDTGSLKSSVKVLSKTNDSAVIGSDLDYAAANNFGAPSRNLPQRQFIDENLINKSIEEMVNSFMKNIFN